MPTQNISTVDNGVVADLDSLLNDLDVSVSGGDVEELIEAIDDAILELDDADVIDDELGELNLGEDDLRKMEAQINRQEAYEEQEATEVAPTPPAKTVSVRAASKAPRAPSAPRITRDLNSINPSFFILDGVVPTDTAELDKAKADTLASMPNQKKVAEKFENLFSSIAAGKTPSTFITQAFGLLDQMKTISSADLVASYKTVGAKSDTEGYNEGTARSQAGQIMHLFDTVKIATRTKQALVLNKDSKIAEHLRAIMNPSASV